MERREIGRTGCLVGEIGLGCMGMSWAYAERSRDLAQGLHMIPIPGTRSHNHLTENINAAGVELDAADFTELDQAPAATGSRC